MLIYGAVSFSQDPSTHRRVSAAASAMARHFEARGMQPQDGVVRSGLNLSIAVPARQAKERRPSRFIVQEGDAILGFFGSLFTGPGSGTGADQASLRELMRRVRQGGVDELYKLDAEFCAVLISQEQQCMTLVKDHFGTRSLHYWINRKSGVVAFASSLGALSAVEGVSLNLNECALAATLFLAPAPGETIFLDINSVPPASSVSIDSDMIARVVRRWRPAPNEDWWRENQHRPVEAFRDELVRAVLTRLGPNGATAFTLSGGIDSSTLACIASKLAPRHTFDSFTNVLPEGYIGPAFDERAYVEKLAQSLPNFRAHYVDALDRDPLSMGQLSYDLWLLPNSNCQSFLYSSLNAKASAGGSSVVIEGIGGDQCVSSHATGYALELLLAGRLLRAARQIARPASLHRTSFLTAVKSQILPAFVPENLLAFRARVLRRDWLSKAALRRDFAEEIGLQAYLEKAGWRFPAKLDRSLNQHAIDQLEQMIRGGGLSGEPAFAVWHGIEHRYPLLDWRLIGAFLAIPSAYKTSETKERLLFRLAARPYVPAFIIERDDKGIGTPYLMTRLRQDRARLRDAFDRFSSIDLWRRIVDMGKVQAGMTHIESTGEWAATLHFNRQVLLPYFLGDYLERTSASCALRPKQGADCSHGIEHGYGPHPQ